MLKNVFGGLGHCPTRTLIWVGSLDAMYVAQQSTAASCRSEEDGLLVPLQLIDVVDATDDSQPALPLGTVSIVNGVKSVNGPLAPFDLGLCQVPPETTWRKTV